MRPVRWGVLGVSAMVGRRAVLPALAASPTADLVNIGSRSAQRARDEAERFGARRWCGDYDGVLQDPGVEAVYVPLPNAHHLPWVLAAAAAGKHVLCEKPLGCTAEEGRRMAEACDRAGVLLIEAYMSQFHPVTDRIRELVASHELGDLSTAAATFTFPLANPDDHRWLAPGGGALRDVGIYCLEALLAAFGGSAVIGVAAGAALTLHGVDRSFAGWLDFGGGRTASFNVSLDGPEVQSLQLAGARAVLSVERAFTPGLDPIEIQVRDRAGLQRAIVVPGVDPYLAMIEQAGRAIRGLEPPARPVARSIATLAVMDRLRAAARQD